jgi:hypothetical protein
VTYVEEDEEAGQPSERRSDLSVVLPSGSSQPVMTFSERDHLEMLVAMYHEHNQLTNIADLAELDRLLLLELLVHRLGIWLGKGRDYQGEEVNDAKLRAQLDSHSTEIRLIKKTLGLDRPARERAKGEGSVAHYWEQLRVRALAFGVNRDMQAAKSIELAMQLISLIQVHDNCGSEKEREDLHCTMKENIQWIRDVYIPEFMAIDEKFRSVGHDPEHPEMAQKYWIRSQ